MKNKDGNINNLINLINMKTVKLLLLLGVFISLSEPLLAKGAIIYGDGPEVSKVLDLPHSEDFALVGDDGNVIFCDLGVMYNQFSLFWIPIWNYGEYKYVLFSDIPCNGYDFQYYELSNDEVEYLRQSFGGIPNEPTLPFWDSIGGKLLLLVIVGGFFIFKN